MQVGSSFEFFTHPRRTAALFAAATAAALILGAAPAGAALITPKPVTPTVVTPTQVTSAPAPSHVDSAPASDPEPDYEAPTPVETSSGSGPSGGSNSGGHRSGGSAQHAVGGGAADDADDSDDEDDGGREPMSEDEISQWAGGANYRTGQRAADLERIQAAIAEVGADGGFAPDIGDAPAAPATNDSGGAAPEAPPSDGDGFATLAVNAIDSATNLAQNMSDLFSGDAERSQGDVVQQMISDFLGSRNEQIASNCQCSPSEIGPAADAPEISSAGSSAQASDNSSSAPESSSSDANSSHESAEENCQCSLPEGEGASGGRSLDDLPPKFEE